MEKDTVLFYLSKTVSFLFSIESTTFINLIQMRKFYSLVLLIIAVASSLTVSAQGLKGFKLKNGLSVYIWEDSTKMMCLV